MAGQVETMAFGGLLGRQDKKAAGDYFNREQEGSRKRIMVLNSVTPQSSFSLR